MNEYTSKIPIIAIGHQRSRIIPGKRRRIIMTSITVVYVPYVGPKSTVKKAHDKSITLFNLS